MGSLRTRDKVWARHIPRGRALVKWRKKDKGQQIPGCAVREVQGPRRDALRGCESVWTGKMSLRKEAGSFHPPGWRGG